MGKRILTKEVLATIPEMVEQRLNRSEIAERLGCTPGTLQTQCCRAGISLRKSSKRGRTPLILSPTAIEGLRLQAHARGCSEVKLATDLLEVIAKDELAVLDQQKALPSELVIFLALPQGHAAAFYPQTP